MTNENKSIKATKLTKIFPHPSKEETNIPIFAGTTFEITSKKPNFLVGPSGSGKTTLLRILMSIESINAGEIYFNELPIYRLTGKEQNDYLKNIGYLDQFPAKYLTMHFSVKKNLQFALNLHRKFTKEEMKKRINEISANVGLDKHLDKRTIYLSGGELRRLCLACNVIFEPSILFLDEPTAQLDDISKMKVMEIIDEMHEKYKLMLVIATHDTSIIKKNPKYEISNGSIVKCQ
jgi:ABC-type lipoprotein export system ATPase subunit